MSPQQYGIDKGRLVALSRWVVIIDANAFGQDQLDPLFAYSVAEVHQFGGSTGFGWRETGRSTEVLVVGVFAPLFNHRLVRNIAQMLEDQQPNQQSDWFCWPSVCGAIERFERLFEHVPMDLFSQFIERVVLIQLVFEPEEQGALVSIFRLCQHNKNGKVYTPKIQILAEFRNCF